MADTNETFSPLDPLGPQFGKLNQPSLDVQGLTAFEGDRLSTPKIEFPNRATNFVPIIPNAGQLDNQQTTVRTDIVGKPPAKPKPNNLSAKDFSKAIGDFYSARAATNQDKNEYARIYSYDASPSGGAFYKRYAADGDETFNKLGFHPFRDNEAIYNAGTSGWADAKRMMVHSFWPMFTHAFKSAPKSLGKLLQGDFSPDLEGARLSEEQSAIGYSSRGGFGSWLNNTGMSFAYTAGVITEALAEEGVLFAATALTQGGAAPALFAATANNARKVPSLLKGLNAADNAIDGMKAMNATLNGLKSPSAARSFWNAAKVEKTLSSNTAKFFNPLSNLTEAGFKIAKNEDNLTGLARVYDATKKTMGGFYGDIRAVNMALSEARLEGGMAQNDTYNQLYDEYYRDKQQAPDNKLQEKMMFQAKEAGMTDLLWNTALIYGSNKLVLDNIVHRSGGARGFLKSKTEELLNLEGGDILKTTSKTTLKTGKTVYMPKLAWSEKNLWNTVKGFAQRPLSKSIPAGISYFKANIGEALQENLQEVIADSTKNYYIDAFSDPSVATHQYARGLVKNAVKGQFSARGFETFASGFVMGMFASPLNAVPKAFSIGYNKIFDNEAYTKYKLARTQYGQQMVNTLSSVDLKDFFDNNLRNYGVQSSVATTKMTASEKVARDASDAAFISQMQVVLEKGMMDYYVDQLGQLQQLTAEEFEEMVPSTPPGKGQEYLDRLPEVIDRAKNMEKKFNDINNRFPNPVNISNYKKDDPEYEDASLTYHAWEEAKRNAIFFNESFENTTKRMSSIINDVTSSGLLKKASFNDMKVLFDQALLKNEAEILKTEVETLESMKGDAKEISRKKRKIAALEKLEEGITDFKRYYVDRNEIVQRILNENKDVAEEDLIKMIDNELGIRNDENDLEYNNKLDSTFREYLKSLASINDDNVFDSDVDSAFEKLRDFYLLSKESQGMVRGINLLHDPKGFVEHVKRNKIWMKELYDNRREYYENLKEQEFQNKEGNDLLNHLASQGLYISLEDYERWRTMKVLPDEIYDDIHKIVIRKSHPMYDEIVRPFLMLNDLQTVKNEMEIVEESVREDLDRLDAEMQSRLDALPKVENKKDEGSLDFKGKDTIKIKDITEQLADREYVNVVSKDGVELTFYKDSDLLRLNNSDGEQITPEFLAELGATDSFVQADKFTITSEANPDDVRQIMDEFAERKAEILQRASEKGVENPGEIKEKVIFSTDMNMDEFPPELYNSIVTAFEEYAEENGLTDLVGDDYDMALDSFLKSSFIAARIVDDYNKEQELGKSMVREPEVPMIKVGDKTMKLTEIPEAQLRSILRTYQTQVDALADEEQTPDVKQRVARLNYGIRKINDYLAGKVREGFSEAQRKTLDLLQPIIDFQNDITKGKGGYLINNQIMKRVTQVIRQFETEEYKYQKEADVKATFNTTIAEQGFNETSIKNFITELRKQKLPGFSEFTYNELQSELNSQLAESPSATNEELLNKVMNTIAEKTYEESRISGNYTDDQVRDLFADKEPKFDETKITREAFDNLFNEDPDNLGYLRNIKRMVDEEGLFVLSRVVLNDGTERGLVLYDEEAGVAGEVDLLAVDRLGNVYIIDTKTGKEVKWRGFNVAGNQSSKKEIYTLQQTAYANLLYNLIGKQAKVSLLPIQVDYETETGRITRAGKPTPKGALEEGKYRIPLEITPEIQEKIDSVIPRKIKAAPPVEETGPAQNEDFTDEREPEDISTPAPTQERVQDLDIEVLRKPIAEATQETLDKIKSRLAELVAQNKFTVQSISQVQELINQRQRELDSGLKVNLTADNLNIGDQLVALNPIFVNKKTAVVEGEVVTIKSIEKTAGFVTVNPSITPTLDVTFSFAELNKMFILKQEVMKTEDAEAGTTPLTNDEKEFVNESLENVNQLLKDSPKKDALKKEADKQLTDDVDTELFEDVTSDC
jgi:hypothetical protein